MGDGTGASRDWSVEESRGFLGQGSTVFFFLYSCHFFLVGKECIL